MVTPSIWIRINLLQTLDACMAIMVTQIPACTRAMRERPTVGIW